MKYRVENFDRRRAWRWRCGAWSSASSASFSAPNAVTRVRPG